MDIKQYLEYKTGLYIKSIDDEYYRKHYVAFDETGNKMFIKVLDEEHNRNNEEKVLNAIKRKVFFTDEFEKKFIIATEYLNMTINTDITMPFLKDCGKVLAEFHSTKPPENMTSPTLFGLLDYYYEMISDKDKDAFSEIYSFFETRKEAIEKEENTMPKKLLHGSFMIDNTGYVGDKLVLFDFESSLVQIPWYDFVVAFNSRLGLGLEISTFLNEYTKISDITPISEDLTVFIHFITLVRLTAYTKSNKIASIYIPYIPAAKVNLLNKLQLHIMLN